jgi:hypothetical protein
MQITLSDHECHELIESAANLLLHTRNGDEGPVLKEIKDRVDDKLDSMIRAEIRAAVDKAIVDRVAPMLDGPWPLTNQYGEHTGKTTTLREMVVQKLTVSAPDSYRRKGTIVEALVEDRLSKELNGALGEELKKAQTQIKAAVDGAVSTKLTEALKSALGLR